MCYSFGRDFTPTAARALGLGDRFRYWRGASGRRYLFTAVDIDALDDLTEAVVILTTESSTGEADFAWVGSFDAVGQRQGRAFGGAGRIRAYAHYLARDPADRHRIVDDLSVAA